MKPLKHAGLHLPLSLFCLLWRQKHSYLINCDHADKNTLPFEMGNLCQEPKLRKKLMGAAVPKGQQTGDVTEVMVT
jgi:hypothetical protein